MHEEDARGFGYHMVVYGGDADRGGGERPQDAAEPITREYEVARGRRSARGERLEIDRRIHAERGGDRPPVERGLAPGCRNADLGDIPCEATVGTERGEHCAGVEARPAGRG